MIVALTLETSLVTASLLLQVAFVIALAFVAYMLWRDFGRRRSAVVAPGAVVFYGAVALLVVDLGWFMLGSLSGLEALAFFLVAGGCGYAAFRTWRDAHRYS